VTKLSWDKKITRNPRSLFYVNANDIENTGIGIVMTCHSSPMQFGGRWLGLPFYYRHRHRRTQLWVLTGEGEQRILEVEEDQPSYMQAISEITETIGQFMGGKA